MKKMIQKRIFLLVVIFLTVACQKKQVDYSEKDTADFEKIMSDIQAMETAFADSYNNRTANGVGYYAPDAASYSQNKPPLLGADVIAAYIEEEVKTMPAKSKISFTLTEIFPSNDGKQVVELGRYNLADSLGISIARGNYMALFEKKDGKYLCIRDMGASELALEEKLK